jgi:hypothetical protein
VLSSIGVSSQGAMDAVLNRLARPNDLGFREFGDLIKGYSPDKEKVAKEKKV